MMFVTSRRCDKPMARSKGLIPCKQNCAICPACIERDQYGNEEHVSGPYYVLLARNMRIRGYHGDLEY